MENKNKNKKSYKGTQSRAQNFLKITCRRGTSDAKIFEKVINQGIDSHLEAFTKSKFSEDNGRWVFDFHLNEVPTLTRRLKELETEEAESWARDIEESASDLLAQANGASALDECAHNECDKTCTKGS